MTTASLFNRVADAFKKAIVACKDTILLVVKKNDTEALNHYGKCVDNLVALEKGFAHKEFYVLVGGEIKTGKSTLINALLEKKVCTEDSEVATNTTSVIRYGEKEKAIVHFFPDEKGNARKPESIKLEQISQFSCEGENPDNKYDVQLIEIWVNSPILKSGIVLMDTPGLGALNPKHAGTTYAAAALSDVILFTTTSSHEINAFELDSLSRLAECARNPIIINVVTKADQGNPSLILEKNRERISKVIKQDFASYAVSATTFTKYKESKDPDDLEDSGMSALFTFFAHLETDFESLYSKHYSQAAIYECQSVRNDLELLLAAKEKPEIINEKTEKLGKLSARLDELESEAPRWRTNISLAFTSLRSEKNQKFLDFRTSIKDFIMNEVKDEETLDDPSTLANTVTTKFTAFSNEMFDFIEGRVNEIETKLYEESHLDDISADIDRTLNPKQGIINAQSAKSGKGARMFRTLLTGTGLIGVGIKVGAFFGPVGAAIGGLLGAIGTLFISDDMKQREEESRASRISQSIYSSVETYVASLSNTLEEIISKTVLSLNDEFTAAINAEKKRIAILKRDLQSAINNDALTANNLRTLIGKFNAIEKDLNEIICGE